MISFMVCFVFGIANLGLFVCLDFRAAYGLNGMVWWPEPGLVHNCFGTDLCPVLWSVMVGF